MGLKWDGHTHTKFCYHGSSAPQELYLDRAIALGFERYTMSEHPPLPVDWVDDPILMESLAMPPEELPLYFQYAKEMKQKYQGRLEVTVGLELDYLPGNWEFTEQIVDRWQNDLEDVVYSVHYLPGKGGTRCIDYTPQDFREHLLTYYGTMERVVDEYFNQVEEAIALAAKLPMRVRMGHINLIRKFQRALPDIDEAQIKSRLSKVIPLLANGKVGIDVNTAGLRVETCGEPYVPEWFLAACRKQGVDCIYGSDAHKPEHLGTAWEWFAEQPQAKAATD
ncbi:histidinol-phosphatase HisJ [Paenibacillus cremeus]|uniref:Histidinol-phosphatase n=1 Tax=Paenibacillus cremeus TaxID=2163881 RepID=A0A559KFP1_9BACL|nr:histidinol-phosphatase HisJ [Paenibacillus cremeus]TVY10944.1 histidinol-phosphatase HisJ [Paenibacillus cremeus]